MLNSFLTLDQVNSAKHANREVTLRAPKSLHYENSESLDFKVHATSAFINATTLHRLSVIFQSYQPYRTVNQEGGLSPGQFTVEYADKRKKHREQIQYQMQLLSTKRKRLILKQERAITQGAHEALELQTYQSGVGHESQPDMRQLPEAVPRGYFKQIEIPSGQQATLIMFVLETTDLIRDRQIPHVTQIAAIEHCSGDLFNQYCLPKVPISISAQQVTGMLVSETGEMTVNGASVLCCNIAEAIRNFFKW